MIITIPVAGKDDTDIANEELNNVEDYSKPFLMRKYKKDDKDKVQLMHNYFLVKHGHKTLQNNHSRTPFKYFSNKVRFKKKITRKKHFRLTLDEKGHFR